jgi:hypothetical protein
MWTKMPESLLIYYITLADYLTRRPAEPSTRHKMNMEVVYRLSAVLFGINNRPEPFVRNLKVIRKRAEKPEDFVSTVPAFIPVIAIHVIAIHVIANSIFVIASAAKQSVFIFDFYIQNAVVMPFRNYQKMYRRYGINILYNDKIIRFFNYIDRYLFIYDFTKNTVLF